MHGHLIIKTHIFLTGATGYIGGSILTRLLSHPLSDVFRITVLLRTKEKAIEFRRMGIHAVVGTNGDHPLLKELAASSDIVIASADADDLGAAKAILEGLKERYEKTGKVPSLIHTSGTGVLIDDAKGMSSTETIYSDLNVEQLASIPAAQPHRIVDLALVEADGQGYVKTYIILPSTIYGRATGPLVDAGLQNPRSQQIPQLVNAALARGRAGVIGKGANIWPNVHIAEVTSLYITIVDLIVPRTDEHHSRPQSPTPAFGHGAAGFYFAENGEHTLLSVTEAIGQAMVDLGKATDGSPTVLTEEEVERYFPGGSSKYIGSNSRCRADRSKAIGWKPKKTTKDMLSSIKVEVRGH